MFERPTKNINLIACLLLMATALLALPPVYLARDFIYSPIGAVYFIPWPALLLLGTALVAAGLVLSVEALAVPVTKALMAAFFAAAVAMPVFKVVSPTAVYLVSVVLGSACVVCAWRLFRGLERIFADPKLHWWKQYARYMIHASSNFRVESKPENPIRSGEIRNISMGGVLLVTPRADGLIVNGDDEITIAFQCLLMHFTLRVKVARVLDRGNELQIGTVFGALDAASEARLQGLIAHLSSLRMSTRNRKPA